MPIWSEWLYAPMGVAAVTGLLAGGWRVLRHLRRLLLQEDALAVAVATAQQYDALTKALEQRLQVLEQDVQRLQTENESLRRALRAADDLARRALNEAQELRQRLQIVTEEAALESRHATQARMRADRLRTQVERLSQRVHELEQREVRLLATLHAHGIRPPNGEDGDHA